MKLIRYRLDLTNFQLTEYLNDRQNFQLLDSSREEYQQGEQVRIMTVGEFTEKYTAEKCKSSIDNKRSNILHDFAKRSPFLSILAKIDNKDVN